MWKVLSMFYSKINRTLFCSRNDSSLPTDPIGENLYRVFLMEGIPQVFALSFQKQIQGIQSVFVHTKERAKRGQREGKERFTYPCPLFAPSMLTLKCIYAENEWS